nr:NUDIX domain-containing protein [Sulfobacillus harzensis]
MIASVSAIVHRHHEQVVLVRRAIAPGFGQWVVPGGYVEAGESLEAAAVRETLEEVDMQLGTPCLQGVYSSPDTRILTAVYAIDGDFSRARPGLETLEVKLFALRDIPWSAVYFDITRQALADWVRKVSPRKSDLANGSCPE